MRSIKIITILFVLAVAFVPGRALAECYVYDYGDYHLDTDCDDIIDNTDMNDADLDTMPDGDWVDNCRYVPNGNCDSDQMNCDIDGNLAVTDLEINAGYQADWNDDGEGDACDDTDFDGIADYMDTCKTVADVDNDPDVCTDTDGDRFEDTIDNCPEDYNPQQEDSDNDSFGDWCDNCRLVYNPDQADADEDGKGDLCETMDYVAPDINDPNDQDTNPYDREYYDFGPDRLEGNGFGKGGCSIGAASADAGMGIMAMMIALLAIARRRS